MSADLSPLPEEVETFFSWREGNLDPNPTEEFEVPSDGFAAKMNALFERAFQS